MYIMFMEYWQLWFVYVILSLLFATMVYDFAMMSNFTGFAVSLAGLCGAESYLIYSMNKYVNYQRWRVIVGGNELTVKANDRYHALRIYMKRAGRKAFPESVNEYNIDVEQITHS